jgi:hypothetical protein
VLFKIVLGACLIRLPKVEVTLVKMLTYTTKNRYTLSGFWLFGLAKNNVATKIGVSRNGLI